MRLNGSVRLAAREEALVRSKDLCRLATVSHDGWPHVVPVSYVRSVGLFYVPSGERAAKVANIRRSGTATLLVDDEEKDCGVMLKCSAEVLPERAAEKWRKYMRSQGMGK